MQPARPRILSSQRPATRVGRSPDHDPPELCPLCRPSLAERVIGLALALLKLALVGLLVVLIGWWIGGAQP